MSYSYINVRNTVKTNGKHTHTQEKDQLLLSLCHMVLKFKVLKVVTVKAAGM